MGSSTEATKRYRAKTKKLGVIITPEYHERLKRYSAEHKIPIRQMVLRSLAEYMKNHPI